MGNLRNSVRRTLGLAVAILVVTTGVFLDAGWGASWSEMNAGLPGVPVGVNFLAIDPTSPSTIYAQANSGFPFGPAIGGLFKTTDGGGSWRAVSSVVGVEAVVIDPKNSSTIYASTDQGVVKSTNGGESWSDANNGLPTGYQVVSRLAIDPITPSTLYAVSLPTGPIGPVGPVAGVFKSTDGGGSWKALNTGLPPNPFIMLLVIDPATPSTIYVLAQVPGPPGVTVIKSTDGGASWNVLNTGLPPFTFINSLAIDPTNSSTIYAVTSRGLFKSTDGGGSWNALSTGLPPNSSVYPLVVDPTAPSTIYAAARIFAPPPPGPPPVGPTPPSYKILKSTDGGGSWNAFNIGVPPNTNISSLAIDPITPSRIYAGFFGFPGGPFGGPVGAASGGVFKSTDGGASWNAASAGLTSFDVRTLAMNPVDASTIYAGGFGGVFKSTDGGANWNGTGLSAYTGSLVADLVSPNILYAQTGKFNGCNSDERLLLKSNDGGASWSDTISPLNSGCILSATFPSGHAAPMAMDPADPFTLYLGESDDQDGYSAVLKSTNGGANWRISWDWFTGLRSAVRVLGIAPGNPSTLYAGIDDVGGPVPGNQFLPGRSGLFKSTDGGASWRNTGFNKSAVNLLAIDPSNSSIIYAGTEGHHSDIMPKGFQGLFKSTDGGASWLAINQGLAGLLGSRFTSTTALIIDPAKNNILYLGTSNGGVFRSSDGGANWSPYNDGLTNLQIRALAVAPGTLHALYAGTAGGVFKIFGE